MNNASCNNEEHPKCIPEISTANLFTDMKRLQVMASIDGGTIQRHTEFDKDRLSERQGTSLSDASAESSEIPAHI